MHLFVSILICIATVNAQPTKSVPNDQFVKDVLNSVNVSESINQQLLLKDDFSDSDIYLEPEARLTERGQLGSPLLRPKSSFPKGILSFLPFVKLRKVITAQPDATAVIRPGRRGTVKGRLNFLSEELGVRIIGEIRGLTPGHHGLHIRKSGSLLNRCLDAGSQFNPISASYGGASSLIRHIGNLGKIIAKKNGVAHVDIFDKLISLNPNSGNYIGNGAVVVHAIEDHSGLGASRSDESSREFGNFRSGIGCGIIVKEFTRHY